MRRKIFTVAASLFIMSAFACLFTSCDKDKPEENTISVTGVTLNKSAASVVIGGESLKLTATVLPENATDKSVTWTSSNEAVATIDQTGLITATAAGTATITVTTTDGNKTATCNVTVTEAVIHVTEVTLDEETLTLESGSTATLSATVKPDNATDKSVTWTSSNEAVATIDQTGLVTAVAAGAATITVTTTDGNKTAICEVTVTSVEMWARSNIVWIKDSSKPDGGYLTFAVTPADNATIPANVQGVLFPWGSLVAVSPMAMTYGTNKILFSPTGDKSYSWDKIPSLIGVDTPPFDDHESTDDDFADYNGSTGFDAATGKGDICRYISAQGWVKGNWRMPTDRDFYDLITPANGGDKVAWTGSTWADIACAPEEGNNANGFFQPESGYFLGNGVNAGDNKENPAKGCAFSAAGIREYGNTPGTAKGTGGYGFYWSGSTYGTLVLALRVYYYDANRHNFNRQNGFPIRCVRE